MFDETGTARPGASPPLVPWRVDRNTRHPPGFPKDPPALAQWAPGGSPTGDMRRSRGNSPSFMVFIYVSMVLIDVFSGRMRWKR